MVRKNTILLKISKLELVIKLQFSHVFLRRLMKEINIVFQSVKIRLMEN